MNKKRTPQQKEKDKLEKDCEDLWRLCVRLSADNRCEYPGCENHSGCAQMHPHHFFNRKVKSTIWWVPNGWWLCAYHHTLGNESAHLDPMFKDIIVYQRYNGWLDDLFERKRLVVKYNVVYLEWCKEYLTAYLKELRRTKGETN